MDLQTGALPLVHDGDRRAALCLHGLGGTPFEVRPLAESLAAAGATVEAPLLAGHGGTMSSLEASSWSDWLASAEAALARLRARTGNPVAVAGFSMGGLLALRLAQQHAGDVAALSVLSTPIRLPAWQRAALRTLAALPRPLRRGWLRTIPKLAGCDVSDAEAKRTNPSLRGFPVRTLLQLVLAQETVRPELPSVHQPALIVHGRQDHTVSPDDSLETAGSLGSDTVETLLLDRSYHLVLVDVERDTAVGRVIDFFTHHAWKE